MTFIKNLKRYLEDRSSKRLIEKAFYYVFSERKIANSQGKVPKIKNIELLDGGTKTKVLIDIQGICSYDEFEKHMEFIQVLFKSKPIEFTKSNSIYEVKIEPFQHTKKLNL
ncbi:hypothetical protein [Clostridium sp. Ade.TY]|uniref:hypothetical protein n=1 Tax=Clostridium sp. Ade.TY TaxID=1391647 RepID=UPI0003F82A1F|nr:hypothetical protein [Clostridium sp. Ade.TY]